MSKEGIKLHFTEAEIEKLISEIENSNLTEESREKLVLTLKAVVRLDELVGMKDATIAKLRKIFGKQTEKSHHKEAKDKKAAIGKGGGNGRNGHDDYTSAEVIEHKHERLKEKDICPECSKGRIYPIEPGIYLRINGSLPLQPVIHKSEKLRCNLCGKVFEADFKEKNDTKFDPESRAMMALLHYKSSMPFYRMESLFKQLGVPLARSTIWLRVEELVNDLHPIWKQLLQTAGGGDLFYIDDTKAKVLSLMLENELQKENKDFRKGMFTTGILAELPEAKVVLYLTGRKHSGENIKALIEKKDYSHPVAIMSDALNVNEIESYREILKYLCLTHGRRNFKEIEAKFIEESGFVISKIKIVYENESHCKNQCLSAKDRLKYHQEHSSSPMAILKKYLDGLFEAKKVEPNSDLGRAIKYMQKHWKGLTAFLHHPGAPLDNNIIEQQLRIPVLNRKNWLFYKNEYGAQVGDIILSIIKTCELNSINPYEYLVTIQKNQKSVTCNPSSWMPWNYKAQLNKQI